MRFRLPFLFQLVFPFSFQFSSKHMPQTQAIAAHIHASHVCPFIFLVSSHHLTRLLFGRDIFWGWEGDVKKVQHTVKQCMKCKKWDWWQFCTTTNASFTICPGGISGTICAHRSRLFWVSVGKGTSKFSPYESARCSCLLSRSSPERPTFVRLHNISTCIDRFFHVFAS